jgi:phage/plasmid primase-like uncharacterized protein
MTASELAARLGLRRYPRSWRGRCPACDYAGNTFSVRAARDQSPRFYCVNGCTRDELDQAVQQAFGTVWKAAKPPDAAEAIAARSRNQERAQRLWSGAETDGAHRIYLATRGLAPLASSAALRFRTDTPHPEQRGRLPAMLAAITDAAGALIGVHRTYLRRDGTGKAHVEPTKASLGTVWGGAIRLDPVASELVIGEGIETAGAAGLLTGLPAWSAISAGNLARGLVLPAIVRSVVIAVDRDPSGESAARAAGTRWANEGRRVRYLSPDAAGLDACDLLAAKVATHG